MNAGRDDGIYGTHREELRTPYPHPRAQRWALLVLAPQTLVLSACDWTEFGYGASGGRSSPDNGVSVSNVGSMTLSWAFLTNNYVASSPAVANGAVYVGSQDSKVYALDASKGTAIWTVTTGGGVVSSPAVANGVLYVGSFDHEVYASSRESQGGGRR
jgi:glucose dehydrogenase